MADFETPKLRRYNEIPVIQIDAMKDVKPFVAKPDHQEKLGFPGELVDNWKEVALAKFAELLDKYRSLRVYMDTCVKCGACTDKCHYFIGTKDPKNMPVARQDLMRSVYRRYFTVAGKYFPKLVGAKDLDKEMLDDWYTYFHQCSQCRRCSVYCPQGIDTAEISMAARDIMNAIGLGQKYCNEIIGKVHEKGNNLGLPVPALKATLEDYEEELKDETGVDVRIPIDVKGAEVLLVTPSADFFAEPHIDSLLGYAKVFHQAGISWTLSTKASEAGNFGMFIGNYENMQKVAMRVRDAAQELGVKRLVVGECGHAWRVAYSFWNTLIGPWDFLDQKYPIPQHIAEVTYDLIERGALNLDAEANDHMTVTFHDSCNVARATRMGNKPGGQFEIPRSVLKAVSNKYVEMPRGTTHDETFCCGGGGCLLTDDLMEVRVKGALPRMEALREVADTKKVTHMVSICAICKSQFGKVMPHYDLPRETVVGLHQMVSNAIQLGTKD